MILSPPGPGLAITAASRTPGARRRWYSDLAELDPHPAHLDLEVVAPEDLDPALVEAAGLFGWDA